MLFLIPSIAHMVANTNIWQLTCSQLMFDIVYTTNEIHHFMNLIYQCLFPAVYPIKISEGYSEGSIKSSIIQEKPST